MDTTKISKREKDLAARRRGRYVVNDIAGTQLDSSDRIDSAMRRADKKGVPCTVVHVASGKIVYRVKA